MAMPISPAMTPRVMHRIPRPKSQAIGLIFAGGADISMLSIMVPVVAGGQCFFEGARSMEPAAAEREPSSGTGGKDDCLWKEPAAKVPHATNGNAACALLGRA